MNTDILSALRALGAVEAARLALADAEALASEHLPLLAEHGLYADDGLTVAGSTALGLLAQVDVAAPAKRGTTSTGSSGWAQRTKLSDAELHGWLCDELRDEPDAGWAKLQARYHDAGFASGWPRFKAAYGVALEALDAEVREAAEAEAQAAADADVEPVAPVRSRRKAG